MSILQTPTGFLGSLMRQTADVSMSHDVWWLKTVFWIVHNNHSLSVDYNHGINRLSTQWSTRFSKSLDVALQQHFKTDTSSIEALHYSKTTVKLLKSKLLRDKKNIPRKAYIQS